MVYFVGAGPGATDLITVRGLKLLQEADIVVYAGSLVNPELLKETKKTCEIYNSCSYDIGGSNCCVKKKRFRTKQIVRLHTGDPSIYGAVKEQMDELERIGVLYEVCPGVSSFCAAAAALQAEIYASRCFSDCNYYKNARQNSSARKRRDEGVASHGATMVIVLSTGLLKELREELLQGYYTEETPCALVYKASWPEQKVIRTTLKFLPEAAEQNHITKTALVVVGDCLDTDYQLSKLYDASFSTEFRQASKKNG